MTRRSRAFTLLEIFFILGATGGVIAFLAALGGAHRVTCFSNAKNLAAACIAYAGDNNGWPPPENPQPAPIFHKSVAPYWGGRADDPVEGQPWYGTNACPSYRRGAKPGQVGQAHAVNTHLCDPFTTDKAGNSIRYQRIHDIKKPSEVVFVVEDYYSYQGDDFWPIIYETARGSEWKGKVGVYPRHKKEGLNFAFVDGHAAWLAYGKNPKTDAETFLPVNPRYKWLGAPSTVEGRFPL